MKRNIILACLACLLAISSAYAVVSVNMGSGSVSDSDWYFSGDDIYRTNGNVGIGTTSPDSLLQIMGNVTVGESVGTGDKSINVMATNGYITRLGLGETMSGEDITYGMSFQYNATENTFYLCRHEGNTACTPILFLSRENNRLGVGKAASYDLDVDGNIRSSSYIDVVRTGNPAILRAAGNGGNQYSYLGLYNQSVSGTAWILQYRTGSQGGYFGIEGYDGTSWATPFKLYPSGFTNSLVIKGGNVGIGTASPDYNIDIENTGDAVVSIAADTDNSGENDNPVLSLSQDGGAVTGRVGFIGDAGQLFTGSLENSMYIENQFTTPLQFATGGNARVTIENDGDIGIGDTTPSYDVDVAGTIRATNGVRADTYVYSPDYMTTSSFSFSVNDMAYQYVTPAMFDYYSDAFQRMPHQDVQFYNYTSGAWQNWSQSMAAILDGNPETSISPSTEHRCFRFVVDAEKYFAGGYFVVYQEWMSPSGPEAYNLTLERSADASSWTTQLNQTDVDGYFNLFSQYFSGNWDYYRIGICSNKSASSANWRDVRMITGRPSYGTYQGTPLYFDYYGRMRLNGTSPSAMVDVNGKAHIYSWGNMKLANTLDFDTSAEIRATNGYDIDINGNRNGDVRLVRGGGKVGVNKDTPAVELDVDGDANVSGTIHYGALQANSPILLKTSDNFVVTCAKAKGGSYYLEFVRNQSGNPAKVLEWVDPTIDKWYHKKCHRKITIDLFLDELKLNGTQQEVQTNITYRQTTINYTSGTTTTDTWSELEIRYRDHRIGSVRYNSTSYTAYIKKPVIYKEREEQLPDIVIEDDGDI